MKEHQESNVYQVKSSHQPKMEVHHLTECKGSLQHSRHPLLDHNAFVKLQVQHNMGFQPHH